MQIPFIGGAYKGRSSDLNAQQCINLYPEIDQTQAKNVIALFGTPGMKLFCTSGATAEVRGLHVMGDYLYAVIGNTLYKVGMDGNAAAISGNFNLSIGQVFMADNGTQLMIVEPGSAGWIYTEISGVITQITHASFPLPSSITFQDGYFIVTKDETGEFYISASYDGETWDAADYATAESNPDNLLRCLSDHGELWLYGKKSIEVWYNSGAADFPYERIQGVFIQQGLGARDSVAQLDNSIFWLTENFQVVRADGYSPRIISTSHIEYAISNYDKTDDAIGFGYTQEGHTFYVLIFPRESKTWGYDVATELWHERSSLLADGREARHKSNCYAYFGGKHIVGDFEDGNLYELNMDTYTDGGNAISRIRTAPVIHNDRKHIFFHSFEIDFESGTGLITGQGSDPQCMLNWSDDGGHTWSNEHWVDIGEIGKYEARAKWRRLGRSRNRIFRAKITDPIKVVMINAHLEASLGVS